MVIVQHRMPRVFKFVVGDKYYQLDMLSTERGRGYNGVNIFIEPTARISFATPVGEAVPSPIGTTAAGHIL